MVKATATSQQQTVEIFERPDGKRSVIILTNETQGQDDEGNDVYVYDCNSFVTNKELSVEDVESDLDTWLNYDPSNEPYEDIINAAIDAYNLELMEMGVL